MATVAAIALSWNRFSKSSANFIRCSGIILCPIAGEPVVRATVAGKKDIAERKAIRVEQGVAHPRVVETTERREDGRVIEPEHDEYEQ